MRLTSLLLLALLSMELKADQSISTSLTMTGSGTLTLPSEDIVINENPIIGVNVTGTATVPPFGSGALKGSGFLQFILNGGIVTHGDFTVTFSPGNTVTGVFVVPNSVIVDTSNPNAVPFKGNVATITGGTGIFAGATGSFPNLDGQLTAAGYPDPNNKLVVGFNYSMTGPGTITVPNFTGSVGPMRFVPITPCRVADTRNANGAFGGPALPGQSSRSFNPRQSSCGIPQSAGAYALNVTVVPHGPLNYLTLWPSGQAQPLVSTLNSLDGRIKANAAVVPAGQGGAISVFATDTTDVVLDINGYFEAAAGASDLAFFPVTPCRLVDTRVADGPILTGGQVRTFNIRNTSCGNLSGAQAYSLNVTAVPTQPLGYLTMWPAGATQPNVSTLNAPTGTIVANAAIVPAGTNGGISVYATDNTQLVIDINGYFAPPGGNGLQFYPLTPCRVVDTRNANGALGGPALMPGAPVTFPLLTSSCGIPTAAQAYSLNATVVPPGSLGYLTLWPAGQGQPLVSTLNATDGAITGNAAIVPAGASGAIAAFANTGTHLVLDINGYFAP